MTTTRWACLSLFALTAACSAADTAAGAESSEAAATSDAAAVDAAPDAGARADDDATAGDAGDPPSSVFVDSRDGRSYRTLAIGASTWFAQNLDYEIAGKSFCYGDSPAQCEAHGRLYLWSVAPTACPPGAHLGSDDEWKDLETALGMASDQLDLEGYSTTRGVDEGDTLKDPMGFGVTMDGFRTGASYEALGDRTYFWTASTRGSEVWRRRVAVQTPTIFRFTNPPSTFAITIRCVLD